MRGLRALAAGGLDYLIFQIDWQGSLLPQRTVAGLRAEQAAAEAAGLEVWWWAWCRPGSRPGAGRRRGGPDALARRLDQLVAELGAPAGFLADCETGGGWSPSRPDLRPIAAAARAAGMPIVGPRWPVDAFDVGAPQLFHGAHITPAWAQRCLDTWAAAPCCWPVLGAADPRSDAAAMRADLAALGELGVPGVLWWTARQLRGEKLSFAVA